MGTTKTDGGTFGSSLKISKSNNGADGHDDDDDNGKKRVHHIMHHRHYFTDLTFGKAMLYLFASLFVICCGLASVAELFLELPCTPNPKHTLDYQNPAYDGSQCPHVRYKILVGMTKEECSFGRRLVMSILMGGLIGWERRQADRPAGIRTMSLVSLGSCLFTINSAFAFTSGPMGWDASRISAAIPSGVGFLGAGLIFKKTEEDSTMVVHGLTTAASVWLSAAVGIACGGELYFAGLFGTALMMLLLRFGPRGSDAEDDDDDDDDYGEEAYMGGRIEIARNIAGISTDHHNNHTGSVKSVVSSVAGTAVAGMLTSPTRTTTTTKPSEQLVIFKDGDPNQVITPGLQNTTRSIDGDTFTLTGESIEGSSVITTEMTPMLQQRTNSLIGQQQVRISSTRSKESKTLRERNKKKKSTAALASIV